MPNTTLKEKLHLFCSISIALAITLGIIAVNHRDVTVYVNAEGCEALSQLEHVKYSLKRHNTTCELAHVNLQLQSVLDEEMLHFDLASEDNYEFAMKRSMVIRIERGSERQADTSRAEQ